MKYVIRKAQISLFDQPVTVHTHQRVTHSGSPVTVEQYQAHRKKKPDEEEPDRLINQLGVQHPAENANTAGGGTYESHVQWQRNVRYVIKAIKPASGQMSLFGEVEVKPHVRTGRSGQPIQVSGYIERHRVAQQEAPEKETEKTNPTTLTSVRESRTIEVERERPKEKEAGGAASQNQPRAGDSGGRKKMFTIQREGRRLYLVGNTYPIKDRIKEMGGHWDPDKRAWWVGPNKADEAEKLASSGNGSPAAESGPENTDDVKVIGKAKYKGRSYYVRWFGTTKRGTEAFHLISLDGKIDFWADASAAEWEKQYQPREERGAYGRPTGRMSHQTLGGIRRYIQDIKQAEKTGDVCAECGRPGHGDLVADLEDGAMKHRRCCDIEP